jgi:hypothetical protein
MIDQCRPPLSEPSNKAFLRPKGTSRIARSTVLVSSSARPSIGPPRTGVDASDNLTRAMPGGIDGNSSRKRRHQEYRCPARALLFRALSSSE